MRATPGARFRAVVERDAGLRAHHRFGAEGDGEAGHGHHLQVVRAVAHDDGLRHIGADLLADPTHRACLDVRIDDFADHLPGELAVDNLQRVRAREVQLQARLELVGEVDKAA